MKQFITLCTLLFVCFSISTAQWTDNQNASQVIGQTNYTSYGANNSASTLHNPTAITIDATNGKAYVVDKSNNRVLRFSYPFSGSPITSEMAFGIAGNIGPTQILFSDPFSAAVYNNVLYVADPGAHRIVRFNSASTKTNEPNADGLIGQTSWTAFASGLSSTGLNTPYDITIDGSGNLWVADYGNNRVLKFSDVNNKATDGTAAADLVLGQSNMTTGTAGVVSNISLSNPTGVCVNGTTVWVVDRGYNRVLKHVNPTSNGFAATVALGQSDLNSSTVPGAVSQNQFKSPWDATIDGNGNLYVSESGDNRVMIFLNASAKSSGGNADNVLGQSGWTSSTSNAGQNGFNNPAGMAIDNANSQLFVVDLNDNRTLRFTATSALPVELSSFTAAVLKGNVGLAWSTATEVNNYGFEVEKRTIGNQQPAISNWQKIGFMQGNGTSNSPHNYFYTDNVGGAGTYLYRLKQIDRDGAFKYSQETQVTIEVSKALALSQNYPDPFNPSTTISYAIPVRSYVTLSVFNTLGQKVAELVNAEKDAGVYDITLDASTFASGVYLYRMQAGSFVQTKKLVVVK